MPLDAPPADPPPAKVLARPARPALTEQRHSRHRTSARQDPALVRWGLTLAAVSVLGILVVVPVVHVFWEALADGPAVYWNNLVRDPATRHALALTLTVVPIAVGLNLVFGVAVALAA